jgi:hypothetical protein
VDGIQKYIAIPDRKLFTGTASATKTKFSTKMAVKGYNKVN